MPLEIKSRIVSDAVVVDVSGRLCFLEIALHQHINKMLEDGHRGFVVNLADVPYVDSFGLGQLVSIWTSIRSKDGQLIFLRPVDHVQKLFQITRLNSIFRISDDEAQAVRSARTNFAASA